MTISFPGLIFAQYQSINFIIIRCKCFFLFIGREPTTWPANNCLQIMVCSCAMSFNCFWLQILFCSCVNETTLFSFLRSLLRENGRSFHFPKLFLNIQTRWSNDKTVVELGKSESDNYRPFSVLPCISKIHESYMNLELQAFAKEADLIQQHQFALVKNSHTITKRGGVRIKNGMSHCVIAIKFDSGVWLLNYDRK